MKGVVYASAHDNVFPYDNHDHLAEKNLSCKQCGNFPTGDPLGPFICAASPNRYHAVTGICIERSAHDIVNGGRHPV